MSQTAALSAIGLTKSICLPSKTFSAEDIKDLRKRLNFSQSEFATTFDIPVNTLRAWEQDINKPSRTSRKLLTAIEQESLLESA